MVDGSTTALKKVQVCCGSDYLIDPVSPFPFSSRLVIAGSVHSPSLLSPPQIFDMMDARSREKCLKEIRLLQSLNHPNIVRYIDSYIDNNELIIVLEFAEGGDLKGLIKRVKQANRVFEEAMIWNYAEQITAGLHHMHAKRIMHRDLKPAYATHLLPCVAFFLLFSEWETIFFLWQSTTCALGPSHIVI